MEQCGWPELQVSASTHNKYPLICDLTPTAKPIPNTLQHRTRTFLPDFLLVRSEVAGVTAEQDYKHKLFAFMYAGIPCVNSLDSIYHFLERPIVHAELTKAAKVQGESAFPVIPQSFFPYYRNMMYGGQFPCVAKVGHAHAGYGKMRIANHKDMEDFRSVIAVTGKYVTAEPYLEGEYDLRVQKIGTHLRCFKRFSISGSWKTNMGSSHVEEIELTEQYRMWAEVAGKFFGGLDICTVDAIHTKDGKEYILEVLDIDTDVDSWVLINLIVESI